VNRSMWTRIAAVAAVFALVAAPALASGEDMKQKETPKLTTGATAAAPAPGAKAAPGKAADAQAGTEPTTATKKNCPVDGSFNTMEDMFGSEEAAQALVLQQQQAAQGQPVAATQTVQWQTVQATATPTAPTTTTEATKAAAAQPATTASDPDKKDDKKKDDAKKDKDDESDD